MMMEFLADHVNTAILEAAAAPVEKPELKTLYVTRWDAKRQLMDTARNYIDETLRLKAEILDERRKDEGGA